MLPSGVSGGTGDARQKETNGMKERETIAAAARRMVERRQNQVGTIYLIFVLSFYGRVL